MATSIYLEAEDEITAAISRIRELSEPNAVLVLGRSSRIGTSRINFKLLAREANAKRVNLVVASDEPTVRALAVSAGLPAYASVSEATEALASGSRAGASGTRPARLAGTTAARPPSERASGSRDVSAGGAAVPSPTRVMQRPELPGSQRRPAERMPAPGAEHGQQREADPARRRRLPILPLALAAVLVLALAGGLYAAYLYLPTATISLRLAPQAVGPLEFQLTADPSVAVPDVQAGVIPAERLEVPLRAEGTFAASGVVVSRTPSSGTVRFESRNTVFDVTIQAQTTLSTADGIEFRTIEAVTVGRADFDTGQPTRAEVAVEAVNPGPAGNVARNTVIRLPEDLAAALISVSNPRAMSGGQRIEQPAVTQEDYDEALAVLSEVLDDELRASLADPASTPRGLTLYPATVVRAGAQPSPTAAELVGSEAETFDLSLSDSATVLAVNEALIDQLAVERLQASLPAGMALVGNSVRAGHEPGRASGPTIVYTAVASAAAYSEPDREALLHDITGKTVSEARAILEEHGQVDIEIWPDVVDRLPQQAARISLTILPPREAQ